MQSLIGHVVAYSTANSGKSVLISGSKHVCVEELTPEGVIASQHRMVKVLLAMASDTGILSFFGKLPDPWNDITNEIIHVKLESLQMMKAKKDGGQGFNRSGMFTAIESFITTKCTLLPQLLGRDRKFMSNLKGCTPGAVLQIEDEEYNLRPNTVYINHDAMYLSEYLSGSTFTLDHDTGSVDIREAGPLITFLGIFNPSIISSWDQTVLSQQEGVASKTRLVKGGMDAAQLAIMQGSLKIAAKIGSSIIIEMRDDHTSQDDMNAITGVIDTRIGGVAREYFYMSERPKSIGDRYDTTAYAKGQNLINPFESKNFSYYRVRQKQMVQISSEFPHLKPIVSRTMQPLTDDEVLERFNYGLCEYIS